ncbi:MAG TPA: hypothetical protein VNL38_04270, partial [Candidatus Nitrosotenuis sp.]|nr:hypothetical protein [Candidatus Nitrosotenuis sp.]
MAEVNTFACDVCSEQKKECNHWWIVWVETWHQMGATFCAREFSAASWDAVTARPRAVACGEEHAQQLFARWLVGSQTPGASPFDAPSQRKITAENAKDAE